MNNVQNSMKNQLNYYLKKKGSTFYAIYSCTISSCPQKVSIGNFIIEDYFIEFIENNYAFNIIKTNQLCNVCEEISCTRMRHIKYQ